MKIKTTTFGELKQGDTFRLGHVEYMYVKTEEIQYRDADNSRITINTLIMNNGSLIYFPDSQQVLKVNVEISEV